MNPTKYFSSKQEHMIAEYLGWSVVVGSGARDFHPGDIKSDRWIGECKTHTTMGHKIQFKKDVWKKIQDEAISQFKLPALFVDDGSQEISSTWCMFPSSVSAQYDSEGLPCKFRANITFDHVDMLLDYTKVKNRPCYFYETKFSDGMVGIVPLTIFKEMFT